MMRDEYAARLLAHEVLGTDPHAKRYPGTPADMIDPRLSIEMRGMVAGIRRELHLQGSEIAERVAAELERQMATVDIDAMCRSEVKKALDAIGSDMQRIAQDHVRKWLEGVLSDACSRRYDSMKVWAESSVSDAIGRMEKNR